MSFHFHDRFSDTMAVVRQIVINSTSHVSYGDRKTISVFDIPAGAGNLASALREQGFSVTAADINGMNDEFADMTKVLPFEQSSFDFAISMEGIEHIPNPTEFAREFSRVTKKGGIAIITTPNISCMYSRLVFLFTGFFFQFRPEQGFINTEQESIYDYGHISPLNWSQIYFHFAENGFELIGLYGNKIKRKFLFPLYLLIGGIGCLWQKYAFHRYRKCIKHLCQKTNYYTEVEKHTQSFPALYARNIVLVMRKKDNIKD